MTYSQRESKIGQQEARGGHFVLTKRLAIYRQPLFLALEYTDQVGYMKMKKGLGFFPINNILL